MALARVVTFDGVDSDRMSQMRQEMEGQDQPDGLNATEIIVLHDADAERSLVVLFFENEEDYRAGDAILDAMPADDTPGRRSGVTRYDVVHRMTA
jgi:hypothetical protein